MNFFTKRQRVVVSAILLLEHFFLCVTLGEKVADRVKASFQLLNKECEIRVLTDGACAATSDGMKVNQLTNRFERGTFCEDISVLRTCMDSHEECPKSETEAFVERLCDFQGNRELFRWIERFSRSCRSEFYDCLDKDGVAEMFDQEDYCQAFLEDGDLEECFVDNDSCNKIQRDYKLFGRLRRAACKPYQPRVEDVPPTAGVSRNSSQQTPQQTQTQSQNYSVGQQLSDTEGGTSDVGSSEADIDSRGEAPHHRETIEVVVPPKKSESVASGVKEKPAAPRSSPDSSSPAMSSTSAVWMMSLLLACLAV